MSNRTNRPVQSTDPIELVGALRQRDADAIRDDHQVVMRRMDAVERQVAQLAERVTSLDTRLSTVDARVAGLSFPEQLAVMAKVKAALEVQLRETVNQLEFFTVTTRRVREMMADIKDEVAPEQPGVSLPSVADLGAVLGGGGASKPPTPSGLEGVDLPPELVETFKGLFGKK